MDTDNKLKKNSSEEFSKDYILLTGGAGFIGVHTAYELLKSNFNVIILDNFGKQNIKIEQHKNLNGLKKLYETIPKNMLNVKPELIIKKKDLLHIHDIASVFIQYKINTVIHFAALKSVNESITNPLEYYDNNINGLINLLKVMKTYDCNNFIFSSSATVYGSSNDLPFKEDSITGIGITNPYGQTKFMAEQILKDYCLSHKKFKAIMLRYFNPVGAHSSGLIGEIPNGFPNNLFPYLLEVGSGKRSELSIFGNDYTTTDGTCIRDFIHVCDLAAGHLASLNYILNSDFLCDNMYNKTFGFYEVFNLGSGFGVSVLEFVETFISVTGVEIPYKFVEKRPGDVMSSYANVDKARKVLGWKAEKTLSDICIDGWNFFEKTK